MNCFRVLLSVSSCAATPWRARRTEGCSPSPPRTRRRSSACTLRHGHALVHFSPQLEPFSSLSPCNYPTYPTNSAYVDLKVDKCKGLTLVHFSAQLDPFLALRVSETTRRISQKLVTSSRTVNPQPLTLNPKPWTSASPYSAVAERHYGAAVGGGAPGQGHPPRPTWFRELGVRVLLAAVARAAARHDRGTAPLSALVAVGIWQPCSPRDPPHFSHRIDTLWGCVKPARHCIHHTSATASSTFQPLAFTHDGAL